MGKKADQFLISLESFLYQHVQKIEGTNSWKAYCPFCTDFNTNAMFAKRRRTAARILLNHLSGKHINLQ